VAVLRRPRRRVAAAFALGVLLTAPVTAYVVTPRPTDLVAVDERRGAVGRVSADGKAFVVEGAGSFRVFTTEGRAQLVTGTPVVVGVIHVAGFEDVPLYLRPAG
jgi:hypothetical protein